MLYNIFRRVVYSTKISSQKEFALLINNFLITHNLFLYHFINIFLCVLIITEKTISIFLLTKTTLCQTILPSSSAIMLQWISNINVR